MLQKCYRNAAENDVSGDVLEVCCSRQYLVSWQFWGTNQMSWSGVTLHLCLRRIKSGKVLESCFSRLVERNQSETFVWRRAEDVLEVCLGRRIINQSKDFVWRCAGYVLLKHSERFRSCLECLEICCRYAGDTCLEKCWRCAYS